MEIERFRWNLNRVVLNWCHAHCEYKFSKRRIARGDYRCCEEDISNVKCNVRIVLTAEQKSDENVMKALERAVHICRAHIKSVTYLTPEEYQDIVNKRLHWRTANLLIYK